MRFTRMAAGVGVLLGAAVSTTSAIADWQFTSWGDKPKELLGNNGVVVVPDDEKDDNSTNKHTALLKAPYSAGDFAFTAYLMFDDTPKLRRVSLDLKTPNDCPSLYSKLVDRYGKPVDGSEMSVMETAKWRDTTGGNGVSWVEIGDQTGMIEGVSSCSLSYYNLSGGGAAGL